MVFGSTAAVDVGRGSTALGLDSHRVVKRGQKGLKDSRMYSPTSHDHEDCGIFTLSFYLCRIFAKGREPRDLP